MVTTKEDGLDLRGNQDLHQVVKYKNMAIIINTDSIYKDDNIIMHSDVTLYSESAADIISENGGNILEIGFGLGISANKVQSNNPDKHVIIEIEEDIYNKALEWASGKSNVEVILGDWKTTVGNITDKFDGIYMDADQDAPDDLESFPEKVKNISNDGCILIQTSWGMDSDIPRNKNTYKTITLDDNTKKWYYDDTLDIIYVTLTDNEWV
jgi:predicted O-methyltransferase YrrM